MKIRTLTAAIILVLGLVAIANGQRRTPPKPTSSPTPQATPEPVTSQPAPSDELTDIEREEIDKQAQQAELKIGLNDIFALLPNRDRAESSKRDRETQDAMEQLAQLYAKAARDSRLMQGFITRAFRLSFDKPVQANARLFAIQTAQNQVLIDQNKRVIQLLDQLARARR